MGWMAASQLCTAIKANLEIMCLLFLAFRQSPATGDITSSPVWKVLSPCSWGKGKFNTNSFKTFPCQWRECQWVMPPITLVGPPNSQGSAAQSPRTLQSHTDPSKAWPGCAGRTILGNGWCSSAETEWQPPSVMDMWPLQGWQGRDS